MRTITIIRTILLIVLFSNFSTTPIFAKTPSWIDSGKIIHAAGGIDNTPYTNSKDALSNTLESGNKVVELDFQFTKDGVLVCTHGGANKTTSKKFLKQKINDKYTAMTAKTALKMLIRSKDTYLVVDAKEDDITKVYKEINKICIGYGSNGNRYRKKIIPQLYSEDDYEKVSNIYKYKNYIFSVYKLKLSKKSEFEKVAKFCKTKKIQTMTIPKKFVNKNIVSVIKKQKLTLATHTINSETEYNHCKEMGVDVIYTDFLY